MARPFRSAWQTVVAGWVGGDCCVRDGDGEGEWVVDTSKKQPIRMKKGTSNGDKSWSLD